MKSFLLVCCALVLSALQVSAQETEENLFSGKYEHGGFGGPTVKVTSLNGSVGVLTGAWGAWLIDHRLALGGGWYNLVSPHSVDDDMEMSMDYGGFTAEYIFDPMSLVHYSVQLNIGAGVLDFSRPRVGNVANNLIVDDVFFAIEPGINAEVNVLSFMRFHVGASYRIASGVDNNAFGVTDSDVGGPSFNLMLKFGKF